MGDLDAMYGDADVLLSLSAEQLAARQELAKILADLALNDFAKSLVVIVDLQNHGIETSKSQNVKKSKWSAILAL